MTAIAAVRESTALNLVDPADAPLPASMALTPMQMAYQLIARGADPASIKDMLDVGREIERDQARRAFDAALSSAKAEIPPILKNRTVDFTSTKGRTYYRHEDLGEIARTVDPILARHGLSYRFRTEQDGGGSVKVTCVVAHRDGHTEENSLAAGRDDSGNKNSIQQIGSAITYLQRYTLKAALGLAASSDDDGAKADHSGPALISKEQADEIRDLLRQAKGTPEKFCEVGQISSIEEVRASDFASAKAMLLGRIRKMADASPSKVDPRAQFDQMERSQ